jgi:hypothetical protein
MCLKKNDGRIKRMVVTDLSDCGGLRFKEGEVKKTIAVNLRNAFAPSGLIINILTYTQGVTLCCCLRPFRAWNNTPI